MIRFNPKIKIDKKDMWDGSYFEAVTEKQYISNNFVIIDGGHVSAKIGKNVFRFYGGSNSTGYVFDDFSAGKSSGVFIIRVIPRLNNSINCDKLSIGYPHGKFYINAGVPRNIIDHKDNTKDYGQLQRVEYSKLDMSDFSFHYKKMFEDFQRLYGRRYHDDIAMNRNINYGDYYNAIAQPRNNYDEMPNIRIDIDDL